VRPGPRRGEFSARELAIIARVENRLGINTQKLDDHVPGVDDSEEVLERERDASERILNGLDPSQYKREQKGGN
jgi:hypothetical protein